MFAYATVSLSECSRSVNRGNPLFTVNTYHRLIGGQVEEAVTELCAHSAEVGLYLRRHERSATIICG
jgi:hypothetical protein